MAPNWPSDGPHKKPKADSSACVAKVIGAPKTPVNVEAAVPGAGEAAVPGAAVAEGDVPAGALVGLTANEGVGVMAVGEATGGSPCGLTVAGGDALVAVGLAVDGLDNVHANNVTATRRTVAVDLCFVTSHSLRLPDPSGASDIAAEDTPEP